MVRGLLETCAVCPSSLDAAMNRWRRLLVTKLASIDGILTVVHQAGKDEYSVIDTVQTELGARTMTFDMKPTQSICCQPISELSQREAGFPPWCQRLSKCLS